MPKPINIEYTPEVVTSNIGLVSICLVESRKEIRIVRNVDQEIINVEEMNCFNMEAFISIVNKYRKFFPYE